MYLLDSNVLIEAKNRYYAFDIAPGFWEWLDLAHAKSLVCSISAVQQELLDGDDELTHWARRHPSFFLPSDEATVQEFRHLSSWAQNSHYSASAISKFASNQADFQLIAHARAYGHTVVTHERSQPNSVKRILIPDACNAMRVKFTDTFSMLSESRMRLVLA